MQRTNLLDRLTSHNQPNAWGLEHGMSEEEGGMQEAGGFDSLDPGCPDSMQGLRVAPHALGTTQDLTS